MEPPQLFRVPRKQLPPGLREAGIWPVSLQQMLDYFHVDWNATQRADWIRSRAQLPATEKNRWSQLIEAISLLPDEELPALLAEILPLLDTWPDEDRPFPVAWVNEIIAGTPNPRHPIAVYLQVSGRDKFKAVLQNSHMIRHIRFFRPNHSSLSLEEAKLLGACPDLGNMTGLDLMYNQLGPMGVYWLKTAHFPKLKSLDIRYNGLHEGGATALAECPWLTQLTDLNIEGNEITNKGLEAILASPFLGDLERLNLSHCHLKSTAGKILVQSSKPQSLKALILKYNDFKTAGANQLGKLHLPNLEELNLGCNEIGDKGLAGLAKASWFPQLHILEIEGNFRNPLIQDAGITALVSRPMPNLHTLNLEKNEIGGQGLMELIGSPNLPALKNLFLGWNKFTGPDLLALVKTVPVFSLQSLKLSSVSLQGFNVWGLPLFAGIEDLDAPFLALQVQDIGSMAQSGNFKNLRRFNLMDSPFGDEGLRILTQENSFPALKELHLTGAKATDAMVDIIEQSGCLERLDTIFASDRDLTPAGMDRLRALKTYHPANVYV